MSTSTHCQRMAIREVVEFILQSPTETLRELQLDDISHHFGKSKVYLQKCFKAEMNTTIGQFINGEKLNRSLILLFTHPDLTIKRLAEGLGFSKVDYFIELFKKRFGVPPCRYRELKNHRLEPPRR